MRKMVKFGWLFSLIGVVSILIGLSGVGFNQHALWNRFIQGSEAYYGRQYTKQLTAFYQVQIAADATVSIERGSHYQLIGQTARGQQVDAKVSGQHLSVTSHGALWHLWHLVGPLSQPQARIKIIIPRDAQLTTIRQTNGSLTLTGLNLSNQLRISGSEEITLNRVNAPDLTAVSNVGDVTVKDGSVSGTSRIKSQDGDVTVAGNHFGSVTASSANGDVAVSNNVSQTGHVVASDGDITLGTNSWRQLTMENENGDIDFAHQTGVAKLVAYNGNGDITGTVFAGDQARIKADSEVGDVSIASGLNHHNGAKHYRFTNDNGDITINN